MLKEIYTQFQDGPNKTIKSYSLNTTNSLIAVKKRKGTVYCYLISYGCIVGERSNPPVLILKENYYCLLNRLSNSTRWRLNGWIPQRLLYFRVIKEIEINWVRDRYIYTFSDGTKIGSYPNMKINYDGTPYKSYHPEKHIKKYKKHAEEERLRKNAVRRSWYHNKKAVERLKSSYDYDERKSDISKVPMEDVFKLKNVSHRRLIIEHYGINKIINSCKNVTIDEDSIDDNPYKLVKVYIPDNSENDGIRARNYLKMVNPSTGEVHFEGVPNTTRFWNNEAKTTVRAAIITVKQALAWRNGNSNLVYNKPLAIT